MTNKKTSRFFYVCWIFFGPLVMAVCENIESMYIARLHFFISNHNYFLKGVFLFYVVQYEPVKYGDNYTYPQ